MTAASRDSATLSSARLSVPRRHPAAAHAMGGSHLLGTRQHVAVAVMYLPLRCRDRSIIGACSSASSASSLRSELDARPPTILQANTSIPNPTYTQPRHAATYVRFATHSWYGGAVQQTGAGRVA